jgi:hypothetical protein
VGNEVFLKTILKLGLDDAMMKRQVSIESQIKSIKTEISSLTNLFEQLTHTLSVEERGQNEMYLKIDNSIYAKNEMLKKLDEEREKGLQLIKDTEKAKAIIEGKVYDNVIVDISGKKWVSRSAYNVVIQMDDDVPVAKMGI